MKNVNEIKGIHMEEVYEHLLLQKESNRKNDELVQ